MEVDYYYLLGIKENASRKEIRSAYRRMAEIYHPDKLRELPDDRKDEGQEIMRLLNEAKTVLLNPEKKEQYDIRIGAGMEQEEVIIVERPLERTSDEKMVAIEKESLAKKMNRVLNSMKDVFNKDNDFQTKIAVAEEIFEAQIMDDDGKSEERTVDDEEVEMKLEFTVVNEEDVEESKPDNDQGERKKRFRILVIEGEDSDEISDDDEVNVEWE